MDEEWDQEPQHVVRWWVAGPVAPAVFGNENPATAHISRWTEASLPGRPLLREVINRNSADLH